MSVSQRRAATRDRLVTAATQVFAQRGVQGASVEEICEAAGFTRGAFYSNFASRDELCLAMLEAQTDRSLAAARDALDSAQVEANTLDALVRRAIDVFLAGLESDPDVVLASMELRLYAAREPEFRAAYAEQQERVTGLFVSILSEAVDVHRLRLRLPVTEVLYLLHAIYDSMSIDQLLHARSDRDDINEALAATLTSTLEPLP